MRRCPIAIGPAPPEPQQQAAAAQGGRMPRHVMLRQRSAARKDCDTAGADWDVGPDRYWTMTAIARTQVVHEGLLRRQNDPTALRGKRQ